MAQKFYNDPYLRGVCYPVIGNDSATFTIGDPVTIDSSGYLIVATSSGERIFGYAIETATMTATNTTVAKKCPLCVQPDGILMQYTADQACTQTDLGQYADVSGTTGAIKMNLAAGSTGQFLVVGFNPGGEGTTEVIVEAAEKMNTLGA